MLQILEKKKQLYKFGESGKFGLNHKKCKKNSQVNVTLFFPEYFNLIQKHMKSSLCDINNAVLCMRTRRPYAGLVAVDMS